MKILAVSLDGYSIKDINSLNVIYKGDSPLRDNMPFFIPEFSQQISAKLSFAVKLNRVGKFIASRFANRYYDEYTFAIDFTAEDLLSNLKEKGYSWSLANSFENSSAFGRWQKCDDAFTSVKLVHNDKEIVCWQRNIGEYLALVNEVIMYLSQLYMMKIGDIIMLSFTEPQISAISIGDNIKLHQDTRDILSINIK